MKVIHTSDWHLGHTLYNFPRQTEQQDMLRQMVELTRKHQPDAFLLSGDVFDSNQPSAQAQVMFVGALTSIRNACPKTTIVYIAGNHDSGSRLEVYKKLCEELDIHVLGSINRDRNLEDFIVKVGDKGYVVAVPYVSSYRRPDDLFANLSTLVQERNVEEQLPVFLMAHLPILHCDARGHENYDDRIIGNVECQELSVFGDGFDYVALGHIHKQQKLNSEGRIRYSGTPIPVGFDEVYNGNTHGALLVECNKHGDTPVVETLPIDNVYPLVNLPSEKVASWEKVKEELEKFPDDIPAYIRLNVEVEDVLSPGAMDEARRIVEGKQARVCFINVKRKARDADSTAVPNYTVSELRELDPIEVAEMYLGERFNDEMRLVLEAVKQDLINNPENDE
jgi:exonuclease SbcD